MPPGKAKAAAGCTDAGPTAAKQLWATGAGDGELGNKVEALGRNWARGCRQEGPCQGKKQGAPTRGPRAKRMRSFGAVLGT